jgi:PAP2 superfamily protein
MLDDPNEKLVMSRRALLVLGTLASASDVLSRTRIAGLSWSGRGQDFAGQTEKRSACIFWNTRARRLVMEYRQDPVYASRTYALLSLAQAIVGQAAFDSDVVRRNGDFASEIVNAGVSAASIRFLSSSFPREVDEDENIERVTTGLKAAGLNSENIKSVIALGVDSGSLVIDRRATDGADQEVKVNPPKGRAFWYSMENRPPVRPYWGSVKTLCINSTADYFPGPPPDIDSPEFKAALEEVRQISSNAIPAQEAMIEHWADSIGTSTPTGHWNLLACDYLSNSEMNETERTNILALLNIAMFDAGVACWSTKYKYWLARPSQVDKKIVVRLKVPNFPSYTSGHSTFSSAAAAVLSHFFNGESKALETMANQASESRVVCGIHYKFDCQAGLQVGHQIGQYTVKRLTSSQSLLELLEP